MNPQNEERLLDALESLLRDLSIDVRYEAGDFLGGMCRYKHTRQMIINKNLSARRKIQLMARELRQNLDVEQLYLVPALREVIENADRLE